MGPSIVIKGTGLRSTSFYRRRTTERNNQFRGTITSLKQLPYLSLAGGSSQLVMIPQSFSCDRASLET